MLNQLNYEIVKEINDKEGNFIGLIIKFGAHQVLIIHRPNMEFMSVGYRLDFDKNSIKKIKEMQDTADWPNFMFTFKSTVSSPVTGNFFSTDKDDTLTGYAIEKLIFPFHEGFSIDKLYDAIQAVVSVGFKGAIFLSTVFGKEVKIETTPEPPPHAMYG